MHHIQQIEKYRLSCVAALTTSYWKIQPAKEVNTCKLTYTTQGNLGGNIPSRVLEIGAVGFLMDYVSFRKAFSQDYAIDKGGVVESFDGVSIALVFDTKWRNEAEQREWEKDRLT